MTIAEFICNYIPIDRVIIMRDGQVICKIDKSSEPRTVQSLLTYINSKYEYLCDNYEFQPCILDIVDFTVKSGYKCIKIMIKEGVCCLSRIHSFTFRGREVSETTLTNSFQDFRNFLLKSRLTSDIGKWTSSERDYLVFYTPDFQDSIIVCNLDGFVQLRVVESNGISYIRVDTSEPNFQVSFPIDTVKFGSYFYQSRGRNSKYLLNLWDIGQICRLDSVELVYNGIKYICCSLKNIETETVSFGQLGFSIQDEKGFGYGYSSLLFSNNDLSNNFSALNICQFQEKTGTGGLYSYN